MLPKVAPKCPSKCTPKCPLGRLWAGLWGALWGGIWGGTLGGTLGPCWRASPSKNTSPGPWRRDMGTPTIFFGIVHFKKPLPRIQKRIFWLMVRRAIGVWGATRKAKLYFFSIVQFEQPDPRYPKTTLLAHGRQCYGCLGRYPRTQTILLASSSLNTPILGNQKQLCWPMVYGIGAEKATPEPKQYFLALSISNSSIQKYPRPPFQADGV